jgi:hypothetical protein
VYFGKSNPPPQVATVEGYSYKPGQLEKGTVYYWKINDGKTWTFRTEGPVVSVGSPLKGKNSPSKSVTFRKGGHSMPLLKVQKGDDESLYNISGRKQAIPQEPKIKTNK